MKITPAIFTSDDGIDFPTEAKCRAYEASLPFVKLLNEVTEAAKTNAEFATEIEKLGRALAADRIANGGRKRSGRKAAETTIDPTTPAPVDPPYYEAPSDLTKPAMTEELSELMHTLAAISAEVEKDSEA